MPLDVLSPILTFLKKDSQNSARVHEGIMYGKVNTAEMNGTHFRLVRVTMKATVPPKTIAIREEARDTSSVFRNGS